MSNTFLAGESTRVGRGRRWYTVVSAENRSVLHHNTLLSASTLSTIIQISVIMYISCVHVIIYMYRSFTWISKRNS